MPQLTFEQLHGAVAGDAVALRSRMTLQPRRRRRQSLSAVLRG